MTIDEVHESLERAALSAYGFLRVAPTEQVVILRRLVSNQFMVTDKRTYMENRGTMKHGASCIVFLGDMRDLEAISRAVPPSLFGAQPQTTNPDATIGDKG